MSPTPSTRESAAPPGLVATLRAALAAALTSGLVFGVADALVADARIRPPRGLVGYLGCFAGAVMAYALVYALLLCVAGLASHPLLRAREVQARFRLLLGVGLATGLFLELYWWTRPFLFYGRSSVSPERLATAAVLALVALALGLLLASLVARAPRGLHLALRGLALVAVVGGFAFIQAEQRAVRARGALSERNRELPNVLLVVVDALRADVLGCYGSEAVETPVIDALAARGVLFERCMVQAPYTWTSFGSILTGKYPRRHGLVAQRPGVRMVQSNVTLPYHLKTARIRPAVPGDGPAPPPGSLRPEDYAAGTFMTGALSHGSGLDRGFDVYTEAMMGHDVVETDSQWSVFRSELLLWIFKSKVQQRVDSSLVVTLARKWLRGIADRRWMAMVHLYSTHTPYDPPREFRERYCDPAYDGPIDAFYAYHREAIERGDYAPTEADVAQIRGLYYAGAAQADAMLGELLDELERMGVLDDTLVILTADHGEDLGEREGIWEHNHMWQTNLHVPLVMAHGALLPAGRRVGALVETVDILPTVCDLLGLELPEEDPDDPRTKVDGESLVPLLQGETSPDDYSFAENALFASIQDARYKLVVPRRGEHDLLAPEVAPEAVFDPAHYVRFFDLERDPGEFENRILAPGVAAEVARLYAALRAWSEALPIPESESVVTARDRELEKILGDLGYAGMMEGEEPREEPRRDEDQGGGR